jgi:hypothetical protein
MRKRYFGVAVLSLVFLIFILQSPISRSTSDSISSFVDALDEIFAVVVFIVGLIVVAKKGLSGFSTKIFVFLMVFSIIGTIGTVAHNLQPSIAVTKDVINCSKFAMTIFGTYVIFKPDMASQVLRGFQKIAYVLVPVFVVLTYISLAFPDTLFELGQERFGLYAVRLFYYHPALFSQVIALIICSLSFDKASNSKYGTICRILCLLLLCMTLRSKAIAFVCVYIFLWLYLVLRDTKASVFLIVPAALALFFVGFGQFDNYYLNESAARSTMVADSLGIANANFPLGLGFGTFGSASAAEYYSPVYQSLDYNLHYGLGYVNTNYATDVFWPTILGQFGWIGLLSFIVFFSILLVQCKRVYAKDLSTGLSVTAVLMFLLVTSIASSAFFNPIAVPFAMLFSLLTRSTEKEEPAYSVSTPLLQAVSSRTRQYQ